MERIEISDIKVFVTAPRNINLVVVKVETTTPGLYGYGCATFTWRYKVIVSAIEEYLKPLLVGRDVDDIEDIWQSAYSSSYWRGGAILNNALSGVDEALWDIKGKRSGLPLYSLLGGRSRTGITLYRHANASTEKEVFHKIDSYLKEGYRYIRVCSGSGRLDGKERKAIFSSPENSFPGKYFDSRRYMDDMTHLFGNIRKEFGYDVELMHDVHERLTLGETIGFSKALEPYRLYFLEDNLPPEEISSYRILREKTDIPLAVGELFTSPNEWKPLIENNLIDYIRCHISSIGGITPARKLSAFAEVYGVKTAFHGPSDLSPIGMSAQMHLDLSIHNFGLQEFMGFTDEEREVFPGCPEIRNGYAYLSDKPGLGVELDEEKAKKYPPVEMDASWTSSRLTDGTVVRP